ncbi:MAG TPA: choice-of-anchor tandem repeat GloVer-containing protein [Rhizomicrobium sp.]
MHKITSSGKFGFATLAALAVAAAVPVPANAQQFSVVYAFGPTPDGQGPRGSLTQGQDGNLYGLTIDGGTAGQGTLFSIALPGKETVLDSFASSVGGINCNTGLSVGSDGSFTGTCPNGQSPYNFGTIFNANPAAGTLNTVHAFDGSDGQNPEVGRPILAADGNYYGLTEEGGTNKGGTAFMITPTGAFSTLYNFGGTTGDPTSPSGPLIQGADGNFYGTASAGGTLGGGALFRMTSTGQITVLHNFPAKSATDGTAPMGGVAQTKNGALFGETFSGGASNLGTIYEIKKNGKEVVLHSFSSADRSSSPCDGLIVASDANLYGTAAACLGDNCGTSIIFEVTAKGVFSVLHQLDPATEGTKVSGPLFLDTNGTFYGTAETGGAGGVGTIYSLNTGLAPFANLSQTSGSVGATIGIYGQGFNAKTKVSFDGTQAKFTMVNANYLQAVVPAGASSGYVKVKSPSLKSLQVFTVTTPHGVRHAAISHRTLSRHAAAKPPSSRLRAELTRPIVR